MKINLIHLKKTSIFEQLQIEEALLRLSNENWCIINEGSPLSIVMGISGKMEELVFESLAKKDNVPIIKRFSGGGTVVVDQDTLFVSFIFQKTAHKFPAYPEPILRWTEEFYKSALKIPSFSLKENDYVIGEHKCAGNAQYLRKTNWLHHSTFLWDFQKKHMDYLKHPKKAPNYREERSHIDFLCALKKFYKNKEQISSAIHQELHKQFTVNNLCITETKTFLEKPHRKSLQLI
ncbi:MAG: lipoate--protein ligase family protein [Simkaniaceae bacterium]|nr:lipoate--protein ligase family protein [Simkaniaceae bacterium]